MRDPRAGYPIGRAAAATEVGGHAAHDHGTLQMSRVGAPVDEGTGRDGVARAIVEQLRDLDQAIGRRIGQRPQQRGVEGAEDRRGAADGQGDGPDHDDRKCRPLGQQAYGVAHVLRGLREPLAGPALAHRLLQGLDVAERHGGVASGRLRRGPARPPRLGLELEVGAHLVGHLRLEMIAPKAAAHPRQPAAPGAHERPPASST